MEGEAAPKMYLPWVSSYARVSVPGKEIHTVVPAGVYLLEISTAQHDCVAILAIEHLVHMQYKDLTTNKGVPLFATQNTLTFMFM